MNSEVEVKETAIKLVLVQFPELFWLRIILQRIMFNFYLFTVENSDVFKFKLELEMKCLK